MTSIGIHGAIDLFGTLKGEYVWSPERLQGDILGLQFGTPQLKVHKPIHMPAGPSAGGGHALRRYVGVKGRSSLYVEGIWTVAANGFTCGRFDGDTSDDAKCLQALRGQILVDVSWEGARRHWRFAFDLGGVLTITSHTAQDDRSDEYAWRLFRNGAPTLTCIRDDDLELDDVAAAAKQSETSMSTRHSPRP